MKPFNLRIRKNETYNRIVTWRSEDPETGDTTYYDIDGWTASMRIARNDETLLTLTPTITIIGGDDPNTHEIEFTINAEDTELLAGERAQYDLKLTGPSGQTKYLLTGETIYESSVTP